MEEHQSNDPGNLERLAYAAQDVLNAARDLEPMGQTLADLADVLGDAMAEIGERREARLNPFDPESPERSCRCADRVRQ